MKHNLYKIKPPSGVFFIIFVKLKKIFFNSFNILKQLYIISANEFFYGNITYSIC